MSASPRDPADASPSHFAPQRLRARGTRVSPGLRLQIVLSLAGLMLLAFVPLFFAVASLTRATIVGARAQAALAVGRAIAAHVAGARRAERAAGEAELDGGASVRRALAEHVGSGGVEAICVFSAGGARAACDGNPLDVAAMSEPPSGAAESVETVRGATGRSLQVVSPAGDAVVVSRVNVDSDADRGAPLVRLVALYMVVFALALLVFAYFALTRLIVRPVEHAGGRGRPRRERRPHAARPAERRARARRARRQRAGDGRRSSSRRRRRCILKIEELTEHDPATHRQPSAQLVRSERMASVGRLAAGAGARESATRSRALMGMEDLLLDGDLAAEAQRDFLERMRRETERIHVVLRDLLDFARPEGPSPTDPGAAGARRRAGRRGRRRRRSCGRRSPSAPCASTRTAVGAPLGSRCRRSASRRCCSTWCSTRERRSSRPAARQGRIVIRARAESAGRARIEVEDDGPGIATAVRDRLFEPFVTTKDVGEGTGLGLAVCRGLVESAGGDDRARPDATRQGARFVVVLPLAGLSARPTRSSGTTSRPLGRHARRGWRAGPARRRLAVAALGRVVEQDDRAVAQIAAHAGHDVVGRAREASAVPPADAPADDVRSELVGDARDDRVRVADGRPEERRAARR